MAFHLEMFSSSIVSTSVTSQIQVNSKFNNVVPTLNNGFQVPTNLTKLGLVAGYSTHMSGIRIQAASMLPFPYPNFSPMNRGSAFESPARVFDFMANPIQLNPTEEIDAFAAAGNFTETAYIAILFTDGAQQVRPAGRPFTAHATASTTLTAGAFTGVIPTFDTPLPAGRGGVQAYDQLDPPGQRAYGWFSGGYLPWGVWMTFQQNVPPTFNCFATSADSTQEFWLDLVAIGAP